MEELLPILASTRFVDRLRSPAGSREKVIPERGFNTGRVRQFGGKLNAAVHKKAPAESSTGAELMMKLNRYEDLAPDARRPEAGRHCPSGIVVALGEIEGEAAAKAASEVPNRVEENHGSLEGAAWSLV
jgi:hypothetical protein